MKLRCLFGKHNYGFYNDITTVEIKCNASEKLCIETCNRICTDCQKKIYLQRTIDTMNTYLIPKWRKVNQSSFRD